MFTRKEKALLMALVLALEVPFSSLAGTVQEEICEPVIEAAAAVAVEAAAADEYEEPAETEAVTVEVSDAAQLEGPGTLTPVYFKAGKAWMEGLDFDKTKVTEISTRQGAFPGTSPYERLGTVDADGTVTAALAEERSGNTRLILYVPSGKQLYYNEDSTSMFEGFSALRIIDSRVIPFSTIKKADNMFSGCIGIEYVYAGDSFTIGAALPDTLTYYAGWDEEGRCGYQNTEIPEDIHAFVTDLNKGCFVAYCDDEDSYSYEYCDYANGRYIIGKSRGLYNWIERAGKTVYTWDERLEFNRISELPVAWKTLDAEEDKAAHVYSIAEIPVQQYEGDPYELLWEYLRRDGKKVDINNSEFDELIGKDPATKDNDDGTGTLTVTIDGQDLSADFDIDYGQDHSAHTKSGISFEVPELSIRLRDFGAMSSYQRMKGNYSRVDLIRLVESPISAGRYIYYFVEDESIVELVHPASATSNQWIVEALNEGSTTIHAVILKEGYEEEDVKNSEAWEKEASCTVTVFKDNEESLKKSTVTFDVKNHGTAPSAQKVIQGRKITRPEDPSAAHYRFGGWYRESSCVSEWDFDNDLMPAADITLYAKWTYIGGGSSGGTSGGGVTKTAPAGAVTFSKNWFEPVRGSGIWMIKDKAGNPVTAAWLCDDAVAANGQHVWYLLNTDGIMVTAGLVQDKTGNYYSLEMSHNGYYGMLRHVNGTYDGIYMEFSQKHDGTFGAITNPSAIEALKAKYGVTGFAIGNDRCVYTKSFE